MVKSIEQILQERRLKNERELKKRLEQVYKRIPRIREIDAQVKSLNLKRVEEFIKSLKHEDTTEDINILLAEKERLLNEHSIDPSYLEIKYHCNICRDTGVVGVKACECRKKLATDKLYDQSMIHARIKKENFDSFNPNLFRKSRMEGETISPYENIILIKDDILMYLDKFGKNLPNLFFHGQVGTGKTFMVNCLAKELMDRGVAVLYQSSNDILSFLSTYQFMYAEDKKANKPKLDLIYDVDILIIDDLGTENINDITKSNLFELINKRMVAEKTTIISSNIAPYELDSFYDNRIYSRIMGEYDSIYFYGNDLRTTR